MKVDHITLFIIADFKFQQNEEIQATEKHSTITNLFKITQKDLESKEGKLF